MKIYAITIFRYRPSRWLSKGSNAKSVRFFARSFTIDFEANFDREISQSISRALFKKKKKKSIAATKLTMFLTNAATPPRLLTCSRYSMNGMIFFCVFTGPLTANECDDIVAREISWYIRAIGALLEARYFKHVASDKSAGITKS